MTIAALGSRLRYLEGGGAPSLIPRSSASSAQQRRPTSGNSLGDLRITRARWAIPVISFGAPPDDQVSFAASEGELMSSGDDDSAVLLPSGVPALPESDPELTAMHYRAGASVGLEWNTPPCPEPSRLGDWYLGAARAGSQHPAPVPFFPEVHDEVTRACTAPFSARNRSGAFSSLTTLNGGAAKGSPRWSGLWRYSCVPRPLPPGGAIHASPPGRRAAVLRLGDTTRPSHAPSDSPWNQVSVTWHTQTPLRAASLPSEPSPCAPPCFPTPGTSVETSGYVCGPVGPACMVSESLASAYQPISLAHLCHQTRLCDSVRPVPTQVHGYTLHLCAELRCPCLADRYRCPTGEGRDRDGPSSRNEDRVIQPIFQERQWVTTDLGPANLESGPVQAPVQDANAFSNASVPKNGFP
ncbi:hypothetical protein PO909_010543 [Leuciscus waleckii]